MALLYDDFRRSPPQAGRNDYPRFVEIGRRFGHGRRPGALFGYLDQFYSRPGVTGFKAAYSQLRTYPELIPYIALRQVHVVHLLKDDPLESVLAELMASSSEAGRAGKPSSPTEPVSIDRDMVTARCRRFVRKQQIMSALLRAVPVPVKEVSYEHLHGDETQFESLCEFLGVAAEKAGNPGAARSASNITESDSYR